MLVKKTLVSVVVIYVVVGLFSGCMFFDTTTFTLISSTVSDDDGFPSLHLVFSISDLVTIKVHGPGSSSLFSDTFYHGSHEVFVHLAGYRRSPFAGRYSVVARDKYDRVVFENEYNFQQGDLSINAVDDLWWQVASDCSLFSLVGFNLSVKNNGDFPVYPSTINVRMGNMDESGVVLPTVLLPGSRGYLSCFIILEEISTGDHISEITVRNHEGAVLTDAEYTLVPENLVSDLVFQWKYGTYTVQVPYPVFLYEYYSSLERRLINDYAFYVFDTDDDGYLTMFADELTTLVSEESEVSQINFFARFVQDLTYAEDDPHNLSCEYPRYPLEMLVDGEGDCEDKAILLASLLDTLGYAVALLRLPNHMAVGVHLADEASAFDYYVDEYYYLEATRSGAVLGFVPKEYKELTNVTVYPLSSRSLLVHSWKNATLYSRDDDRFVKMKILVENLGSAAAFDAEIHGMVESQNSILNHESSILPSIFPREKAVVDLTISVPAGYSLMLKTQVFVDGELVDEKESTSAIT
jgi:hypothetical protein